MTANALPKDKSDNRARIVGRVDLARETALPVAAGGPEGDFLAEQAARPWNGEQVRRDAERVLAEIRELQAENRWEDIISLFHPVDEKLPDLVDSGMADEVRLKVGFVLCRAGRHDEALACLEAVVRADAGNALAHYTLAYTALDALFAARTLRQPLPPREKKRLVRRANDHFDRACELRPDSVTFYYRHGVLRKEIENKPRIAAPLFGRAIANWEQKDAPAREREHQQFPKYIKALYHLASCHLQNGMPSRSLSLLEKVMEQDRDRDHMHPLFKHFAMGKVLHALGEPGKALEHLEVAVHRADRGLAVDFVHELSARCALQLDRPEQAARFIDRVPRSRRRPYVRWTESDVLVAKGRPEKALQVLAEAAERDRRGRHKALIRMARISLSLARFKDAEQSSRQAAEFCRDTYGSPSHEAMFWLAAALYRQERYGEALEIVRELEEYNFQFPNFRKLADLVRRGASEPERAAGRLSLVG